MLLSVTILYFIDKKLNCTGNTLSLEPDERMVSTDGSACLFIEWDHIQFVHGGFHTYVSFYSCSARINIEFITLLGDSNSVFRAVPNMLFYLHGLGYRDTVTVLYANTVKYRTSENE